MNKSNEKYKFVYDENCCASAGKDELFICASCGKEVCAKCAVTLNGVRLHRECSASQRHNIKLLTFFRKKNLELKEKLIHYGLDISVPEIKGAEQKPSCCVSINSQAIFSNLFMWSSGECECQVINAITGNQVFWKYRILNTDDDVENYLNDIYGVLLDIIRMPENRENTDS